MKAAVFALISAGSILGLQLATAADLPARPRAVEYLEACALNVGGYQVPGTDTCLKISGYARVDHGWHTTSVQVPQTSGAAGAQDRSVDAHQTRHRLLLQFDSRTPTEAGTLRTVTRFYVSNQSQTETLGVSRAFIQWAGFTIGRAPSSAYIYGFSESWQHITAQQNQPPSGEGGVNQISYSLELGQGVHLSLGADERQAKTIANLSNGAALKVGSDPANSYAGQSWPDLHLDLKNRQDWGHISTSVIVHNVSATYYSAQTSAAGLAAGLPLVCAAPAQGDTVQCSHPKDRLGWTIASGGEIKVPFQDLTDRIGFFALYAQGKIGGQALTSQALFGSGNRLAVGWMSDGVFVNGSRIELTTVWAAGLGYEHAWSPVFRTAIFGAYEEVRYNRTASSYFCGLNGAATIGNITFATCGNPSWSFLQGTLNARWAPASHFELIAEVWYVRVFSGFAGAATLNTSASGLRPTGAYTIGNQGLLGVSFRAVRYFNFGSG
jgi:Porin subfamily